MRSAHAPDSHPSPASEFPSPLSDLRRRAEARLKTHETPVDADPDRARLLRELRLREIEVELQAEEIRALRAEVDNLDGRCRDFHDFAPAGYLSLDRSGVILETNLAGARLLALECAHAPGHSFAEFLAKPEQSEFDTFLQQLFATGASQVREVTLAGKHQPPVLVQITATLSADKLRCRAVVEDVTVRRRTEEALRHEQILFQNLASAIPDHIYFKDCQSRFVRINNTMAGIFGLNDPSQAIGKTDFDFFTKEHAQQAYDDEQRIMRTGAALIGLEEKETWPGGRVTWVSTSKVPLRDANGHITGLVGISRDITEHKRMEEALAEQAETYRALFSTAFDGVVEMDGQLQIVDANRVYCRLLGYNRVELLGRSLLEIAGNATPEQARRQIKQLQREGGGRFETLHRAKDGRMVAVEVNATFIPNRGRFVAFCHEIVARRQPADASGDASRTGGHTTPA
jgi:PAS domain S-box-containing protein